MQKNNSVLKESSRNSNPVESRNKTSAKDPHLKTICEYGENKIPKQILYTAFFGFGPGPPSPF